MTRAPGGSRPDCRPVPHGRRRRARRVLRAAAIVLFPRALTRFVPLYAPPHFIAYHACVGLIAGALPGTIVARAAVVVRKFEGQIEGREYLRGVWNVLYGEEEREILWAYAGGSSVKDE